MNLPERRSVAVTPSPPALSLWKRVAEGEVLRRLHAVEEAGRGCNRINDAVYSVIKVRTVKEGRVNKNESLGHFSSCHSRPWAQQGTFSSDDARYRDWCRCGHRDGQHWARCASVSSGSDRQCGNESALPSSWLAECWRSPNRHGR